MSSRNSADGLEIVLIKGVRKFYSQNNLKRSILRLSHTLPMFKRISAEMNDVSSVGRSICRIDVELEIILFRNVK